MLLIPTLFCPKPWAGMSGNETQRFCSYCKKQVHNLEAMSVRERLTLLASPAASICSRYQVAIRRPVPGKERAYHRHLVKHGVGVALAGSVLLVLWEMDGQIEKQRYYRAATNAAGNCAMPRDFYAEQQTFMLGKIYIPPRLPETENPGLETPDEPELTFDPAVVDRLIPPLPRKINP